LPEAATASLLDGLLGTDPALAATKTQLAVRTGGNPFFLEECVRALGNGASDAATFLPETVHAVIGARLDRLAPEDKRLLQVAAVIGTDIPCTLLAEIADYDDLALESALRRLQSEEFLLPLRVLPDRLLRFKHALTHEVVTASLLRQQRRDLHAKVLTALAASQSDNLDVLAHHALQAEDWPRAAAYAAEAASRAALRNANRQAIGHFTRALAATAHLPATPARQESEIDLRLALRDALFVVGDTAGIPALLADAVRIADEIGDATRLAQSKLILSGWHWSAGEHRQALAVAEDAATLARAQGATLLEALSQYRRGISLNALGDYAASVTALRGAMAQLDAHGLRDTTALGGNPFVFCCNFLTWSLAELGDFDAARDIGRQGWEAAWTRPNFYTRSVMTFGYGHTLVRAGDHDAAREVLESGLALFDANDLLATFPFIAAPLGYLLVATGEVDSGLAHLARATNPAARRMAPAYAHVDLWHADAALLAGDLPTAEAAARRGLAAAEAQHETGHAAWAHRCLGDVLRPHDPVGAAAQYRSAGVIAARHGMAPLQAAAARGLAEVSAESHV
jgi:tetratricopeptide (TPR) repeat protein